MVVARHPLLTASPHSGKLPPMKSLSTAFVDCDERVSIMKLAIQGTVVKFVNVFIRYVRSTPPMNRACAGMGDGVLLLLVGYGQVDPTVAELVIAQAAWVLRLP